MPVAGCLMPLRAASRHVVRRGPGVIVGEGREELPFLEVAVRHDHDAVDASASERAASFVSSTPVGQVPGPMRQAWRAATAEQVAFTLESARPPGQTATTQDEMPPWGRINPEQQALSPVLVPPTAPQAANVPFLPGSPDALEAWLAKGTARERPVDARARRRRPGVSRQETGRAGGRRCPPARMRNPSAGLERRAAGWRPGGAVGRGLALVAAGVAVDIGGTDAGEDGG